MNNENRLDLTGLGYYHNRTKTVFADKGEFNTLSDKVDEIIAEGGEPNVIETVKVNNTALVPDANKAVNIDLSGYAETSDIPTDLSDLTNTGQDPYATESYVDQNGGKIDKIKVNGTEQTITNKAVDITVPTNNNQLTNGAGYQTATDVETAITAKLSSTYKAGGTVAFANLPSLTATNEGKVYNVSDSFTTTSDFVEGAGKEYPAGTNVVIINVGTEQSPSYKYDVMAGFVDLSGYFNTTNLPAITTAQIDTLFS